MSGSLVCEQGYKNYPEIQESPQNCKVQLGSIKQDTYQDPQIFGVTIQNLVFRAIWHPWFVHFYCTVTRLRPP